MIGNTYGNLKVIGPAPKHPKLGGVRLRCSCSCGNEVPRFAKDLRAGRVKSCGCLHRAQNKRFGTSNISHGHARAEQSGTYRSWRAMQQRCADLPYRRDRKWYRGVKVCERWKVFENFLADMGERPKGHTLDRYPDKTGNYEPGNCRWATMKQQAANRRSSKAVCNE